MPIVLKNIAKRWNANSPYFQIWEKLKPTINNVVPKGQLKNASL